MTTFLSRIRPNRSQIVALALVALAFGAGAARAQGNPSGSSSPQIIDERLHGEGDRLERRTEWFFESRRAGTVSAAEMAGLRAAGVEQTKQALALQSQRRAAAGAGGARGVIEHFWVEMGPSSSRFGGWSFGNVSGRIPAIAADWAGGVLYVGTASGGLWKSTNDGLSWTQLFDAVGTMTIGSVAVDPNDPNVLWAGTGENTSSCEGYFGIGLMRSGDGGQTWEPRNGTANNTLDTLASFADVIIDPRDSNHIITGGRIRGCASGNQVSGGLYTTTDGGVNWTRRIANTEIYEIAQDPSVLDTYWAGTAGGVYKSTDNGVTWDLQTASGLPAGGTGRTEIAIAPSHTNTVYALFAAGGGSFWRTQTGGASWTEMSTGSDACDGQCWYNSILRVDPTNRNTVYRGNLHIYRSSNGGTTWTDLSNNWGSNQTVHQDTHHFLMNPSDPDEFYVGCDGGIWKTEDGGAVFTNLNSNLNITQFYAVGVDASDPNVICGGSQDNSSLARTTDNVWDLQQVTGDGFVCHINPLDNDYAYITSYPAGGTPSIYRSENGVLGSFSRISGGGSGINVGDRSNWVTPYLLDPTSPNILYVGTQRVYRSTDHGSTYTAQNPSDMTAGSGSLKALEINRNFPTYLFAGSASGRVWATSNSGTDWSDITAGLPNRSINDIAGDPSDPERAVAVVGGFNSAHFWEWTASGGWISGGAGLPNVPANAVLMLSDLFILVGTDTGVFRSLDGGISFEPYMNGMPQGAVVTDLKVNLEDSTLTAGTYGRGAWQTAIDPITARIIYDSVELPMIQDNGDGDDKIEPGETWSVNPVLLNAGGRTALGLTARLVTDAPGITILEPATGQFGNVPPGFTAMPETPFTFTVDPSFPCGEDVTFDIVDVQSTELPEGHEDQMAAFAVTVVDDFMHPITETVFDEGFDADTAGSGWEQQFVTGPETDSASHAALRWELSRGDGDNSYSIAGAKPAGRAWLHVGGTDSSGGAGIEIPAKAIGARLILVHSYDTGLAASGRVVVDAEANGRADYISIKHDNRALTDRTAFQGSSGGLVTSTMDLSRYAGRRIHLAFVYGPDGVAGGSGGGVGTDGRLTEVDGWTIERVTVETLGIGLPICQVSEWPGSVPDGASFNLVAPDSIEAVWGDSCNAGNFSVTTYSIQAGDLDTLHSAGTFSHAPVDAACGLSSPSTFTPGPGNEYYLIAPNAEGREGGQGSGSDGAGRPQTSVVCGERREAVCVD